MTLINRSAKTPLYFLPTLIRCLFFAIIVWIVLTDVSRMAGYGQAREAAASEECRKNLKKRLWPAISATIRENDGRELEVVPTQFECWRQLLNRDPKLEDIRCPRNNVEGQDPPYFVNPLAFVKPLDQWDDSDVLAIDHDATHGVGVGFLNEHHYAQYLTFDGHVHHMTMNDDPAIKKKFEKWVSHFIAGKMSSDDDAQFQELVETRMIDRTSALYGFAGRIFALVVCAIAGIAAEFRRRSVAKRDGQSKTEQIV